MSMCRYLCCIRFICISILPIASCFLNFPFLRSNWFSVLSFLSNFSFPGLDLPYYFCLLILSFSLSVQTMSVNIFIFILPAIPHVIVLSAWCFWFYLYITTQLTEVYFLSVSIHLTLSYIKITIDSLYTDSVFLLTYILLNTCNIFSVPSFIPVPLLSFSWFCLYLPLKFFC